MRSAGRQYKVTVVIPTYNRAALLTTCIQSVLSQTHSDLEVIVVDDGSTDSTHKLLGDIADPRVRTYRQGRLGAQAARNLGMSEATGDYICFLDDDDLWHPRKLERQVALFISQPGLDGVVCQTLWFRSRPGDHNVVFNRLHHGDPLTRFLRLDVVWQTAASLWRLDFAQQVGPWDERLTSGQDLDFHTRCLCFEPKIGYLDEVLNYFREHAGIRITKDRKEEHPANALYAMENAYDLLRGRGMLTPERGLAIASTLMRQSRTLALYGETEHVRRCLDIACEAHPSRAGRWAIQALLRPLDKLVSRLRPIRPLARLLRKTAQVLMYASGLELRRVEWWQRYPLEPSAESQMSEDSPMGSGPERA